MTAHEADAPAHDAAANDPAADDPESPLYSGVPLETSEGTRTPQQMNVGRDNMEGGGEWPDPHTPPRAPAPGSAPRSPEEAASRDD